MGHPRPLFRLFSSFRTVQLLKNLAANGIRTQIDGAVGKNADHYTTTTSQNDLTSIFDQSFAVRRKMNFVLRLQIPV